MGRGLTGGAGLALVLVLRFTQRQVELQTIGTRHVTQHRYVSFEVTLDHIHVTGKRLAVLNQIVGTHIIRCTALRTGVGALLFAVLDTGCALDGAGTKALEQIAGGVKGQHRLLVIELLEQVAEGVVMRGLGHHTRAEGVQRDAALGDGIGRALQCGSADGLTIGGRTHARIDDRIDSVVISIEVTVVGDQLRAVSHAVLEVTVPSPRAIGKAAIETDGDALDLSVEVRMRIDLAGPILVEERRTTGEQRISSLCGLE